MDRIATSAVTLYLIAGVPQITADLMQRRKSAVVGQHRTPTDCLEPNLGDLFVKNFTRTYPRTSRTETGMTSNSKNLKEERADWGSDAVVVDVDVGVYQPWPS